MKNRIKDHRTVRAGDLVSHELNPRTHNDTQREALEALYADIGFARSLLAYELPDGRLKLIDGHLRQSMDPNAQVTVEVLDVSDEEARKLLLSIDPLAQLADFDTERVNQLRQTVDTDSEALTTLWQSLAQAEEATQTALKQANKRQQPLTEKFLVLIECASEQEQLKLLRRFKKEGLQCSAKIS